LEEVEEEEERALSSRSGGGDEERGDGYEGDDTEGLVYHAVCFPTPLFWV
jgi:hypothetical protein